MCSYIHKTKITKLHVDISNDSRVCLFGDWEGERCMWDSEWGSVRVCARYHVWDCMRRGAFVVPSGNQWEYRCQYIFPSRPKSNRQGYIGHQLVRVIVTITLRIRLNQDVGIRNVLFVNSNPLFHAYCNKTTHGNVINMGKCPLHACTNVLSLHARITPAGTIFSDLIANATQN